MSAVSARLDKLSAVYVFCFVLVLVLVQIYAHLLFTDFGAKRVALVFNFTLSVAAVVLPAQYLRTMHRINPLYWRVLRAARRARAARGARRTAFCAFAPQGASRLPMTLLCATSV